MQTRKRYIFYVIWGLTTLGLGWCLLQGYYTFDAKATLPALLGLFICTMALLWCLSDLGLDDSAGTATTRRGRFGLFIVIAVGVLFPLRTLVGPPLLFALPVLGIILLIIMRPKFKNQEIVYALGLALVAGVAGFGAEWIFFPPGLWAVLQVALVLTGLLAGWGVLKHTGLSRAGVGRNLYLERGAAPAMQSFAQGMLISMPWAFANVVMGGANGDTWPYAWWQPFVAIQPAIAEEAWGRVLLVPVLFLAFRQVARTKVALTAAILITGYWFAYLHTPGGLGAIFSTLMMGTLYALPISYLWLRHGLETAIGFHFWIDFVKFVAAFFLNRGL